MRMLNKRNNYTFEQYWYLGFLGFIGFYEFPQVLLYFQGEESFWVISNLLWFLWFSHFMPKMDNT